MRTERLEQLLIAENYHKISANFPEYTFYFCKESGSVNIICVMEDGGEGYLTPEQHAGRKQQVENFFRSRGETEIHMLSLYIGTEEEKAKQLAAADSFCWCIDPVTDRLVIYENQVPDFYGWKGILEDFLYGKPLKIEWKKLPWVTIILVAVNTILFLICTFTGELLYNEGALSVSNLLENGDFYRILTSMFLHADVMHLFSNMIVLYYVGEIVEKRIGHIPYGIVYFLSGIAGNVLSMAYELWTGQYVSSVGASGAIFGIEGALLVLIILHHGRMEYLSAGRVAFAIAFSLYCGFTSSYTNNAAHIGGVLMGITVMGILWLSVPRIREKG